MDDQDTLICDTCSNSDQNGAGQCSDRLPELICSYYPGLEKEWILTSLANFEDLSASELKVVLEAGTKVQKGGKRILAAYLRAAPSVYALTGCHEFERWLSILSEVSEMSVFCGEGFLDSSPTIIKNGGIHLLESWAGLGLSRGQSNRSVAIAYFEYSGKLLVSARSERFTDLVSYGERLGSLNARVGESYFKNLPELADMFLPEDMLFFCNIIEKLLEKNWNLAIEMLNGSKEVFSSVPVSRIKIVLDSIDRFTDHNEILAMALFRNVPGSVVILDDRSFEGWTELALRIARTNNDAAITFMDESPDVLGFISIEEIEGWVDKGLDVFSDKDQALRKFIHGIFKGFQKHAETTGKEGRAELLDTGARLALINADCVESYFQYAPEAIKLLKEDSFKEWTAIGEAIALQSSAFGSGYYKDSVKVLRKDPSFIHGELLGVTRMLLEKDWLLAGVFINDLPDAIDRLETIQIRKWAGIGLRVYEADRRLAVDYFSHSPQLLADLDISELEEWALNGIRIFREDPVSGRPYFSLRSKASRDLIAELTGSVSLKKVSGVLRYFGLGLSGVDLNIRSLKELPFPGETDDVNPVIAGRTIYLAPKMSAYGNLTDNFRIYKLSIMHEVGHILFSSRKLPLDRSSGLIERMARLYPINEYDTADPQMHQGMTDISDVVGRFPNPILAASIFGLLEDARVEYRIMEHYRGVRLELEHVRRGMLSARPAPAGDLEGFMDSLLWLSTGQEPISEPMEKYAGILNKARKLMHDRLFRDQSSTLDSIEVTFEIYGVLEELFGPLQKREYSILKNIAYRGVGIESCYPGAIACGDSPDRAVSSFIPYTEDLVAEKGQVSDEGTEEKKERDRAAYAIEKNWKILGSYRYDEWDYVINDYRSDWCTVNEIEPVGGTSAYYDDAVRRYGNEIALIERIFNIMRPVDFRKLKKQIDGTEIDIDSFIESLIEKKCGINPDDRLYLRWDKQKRDVATLFLLDVSASTGKRLGAEKRTIIDVEKDALIVMIHALESIGDKYAINAFSGHGRGGVEYFTVKGFEEEMSDTVVRRIGSLEPVSNTRLGAAIRHSVARLEDVEARTKIIVLLSDGEPYDTCRGEGAYQGQLAEEDTRVAIQELHAKGMHLFCITVDSNPGEYLDNIFSDIGYTIIDDACMLPETLPVLYKRITT